MTWRIIAAVAVSATMATGCVSMATYTKTLAELKESRKARAETSEAFAQYQKQATADMKALQETIQSTEQALARLSQLEGQLQEQAERLKATQMEQSRLEQERAARDTDIKILAQSRAALSESLEAQNAERKRLEEERAAKDGEIRHLTQAHAALAKSLEAEMAKGDIWMKQVRDRLTITLVDRVLFDSGRAQVKPDGLKVLKRVSDILKHVRDKQIRIEGHTDNVPIGTQLRDRFPTNWELSTARASSVVRYLIEKGGVNRASLSAVGYAENRPVASNDGEKGRAANRRIEIVLYPKDLTQVASQINP